MYAMYCVVYMYTCTKSVQARKGRLCGILLYYYLYVILLNDRKLIHWNKSLQAEICMRQKDDENFTIQTLSLWFSSFSGISLLQTIVKKKEMKTKTSESERHHLICT